jgi:hypothetical protein
VHLLLPETPHDTNSYVIVHGKIAFEGASAEELNNNELVRKISISSFEAIPFPLAALAGGGNGWRQSGDGGGVCLFDDHISVLLEQQPLLD